MKDVVLKLKKAYYSTKGEDVVGTDVSLLQERMSLKGDVFRTWSSEKLKRNLKTVFCEPVVEFNTCMALANYGF